MNIQCKNQSVPFDLNLHKYFISRLNVVEVLLQILVIYLVSFFALINGTYPCEYGGMRTARALAHLHQTDSHTVSPELSFETYRRRVVSLSKTLYSPKVLVNYPGSGGSVPT